MGMVCLLLDFNVIFITDLLHLLHLFVNWKQSTFRVYKQGATDLVGHDVQAPEGSVPVFAYCLSLSLVCHLTVSIPYMLPFYNSFSLCIRSWVSQSSKRFPSSVDVMLDNKKSD